MIHATNKSENSTVSYALPNVFRWSLLTIYILIICVSIGGNFCICLIVSKIPKFRSVTHCFIFSLAVTDITMTCFCVPFTVSSNLIFYYWPFGMFLCPFVSYVQVMSVLHRSFTLVSLTCDRYFVTLRPMKPRLDKKKAKIIIFCVWITAAIVSVPTAYKSTIEYLPYEPGSSGLCLESWKDNRHKNIYGITIMMLQYFIPLILMIMTYTHIVIIMAKRPPGEANTVRDQRLAVSKRRTIKMTIAVVIAYALSWLPLHVITLVGDINPTIFDCPSIHMLWLGTHCLAFSNSSTNPILYFWMSPKFRRGYTYMARVCCCRKSLRSQSMEIYKEYVQMSSFGRTSLMNNCVNRNIDFENKGPRT